MRQLRHETNETVQLTLETLKQFGTSESTVDKHDTI